MASRPLADWLTRNPDFVRTFATTKRFASVSSTTRMSGTEVLSIGDHLQRGIVRQLGQLAREMAWDAQRERRPLPDFAPSRDIPAEQARELARKRKTQAGPLHPCLQRVLHLGEFLEDPFHIGGCNPDF